MKFSHHILLLSRRQKCPNTEILRRSVQNNHVFEFHISTYPGAPVYAQPLIGNRMSCRPRGCLRLVNGNRAFRMFGDISSDKRPPC